MSGGAEEGFDIDESLVPLLDLVLQMVMFFMICANFVMEQVNETIKLPSATAAKSLDKAASDVIFVNIDDQGFILRLDGDPLKTPPEIKTWFKNKYRDAQDNALRDKTGDGKVKTLVIIRAHQSAKFEDVYRVLAAVRESGFRDVRLRAIIEGSMGTS